MSKTVPSESIKFEDRADKITVAEVVFCTQTMVSFRMNKQIYENSLIGIPYVTATELPFERIVEHGKELN